MKKTIVKLNKTGKTISLITGLILGIYGLYELYNKLSMKNVTGEWYLEFKVLTSSYHPYIGETHSQKIFFTQKENSITGKAEKWEYNGKLLDFSQHRKLEYEGTVEGSTLKATYIMHGRDRDTEGIINCEISSDGKTITGTFSGTAANTTGTIRGERKDS